MRGVSEATVEDFAASRANKLGKSRHTSSIPGSCITATFHDLQVWLLHLSDMLCVAPSKQPERSLIDVIFTSYQQHYTKLTPSTRGVCVG